MLFPLSRKVACLLISLLLLTASLFAATYRFDNDAGTHIWNTNTNWNSDILPTTGDAARIRGLDYDESTPITVNADTTLDQIRFIDDDSGTGHSNDHSINDSGGVRTITLQDYLQVSVGTVTIETNIDFDNGNSDTGENYIDVNSSGGLVLGDASSIGTETVIFRSATADQSNGSLVPVRIGSGATITFNSKIDFSEYNGAGGDFMEINLTNNGTGTIRVNSDNSGTGVSGDNLLDLDYIEVGANNSSTFTWELAATNALHNVDLRYQGATGSTTKVLATAGGVTVNNKLVLFSHNGTKVFGGSNSSGTATFAGNFELGVDGGQDLRQDTTTELQAASGGTVDFTGALKFMHTANDKIYTFNKTGDGTFILNSASNDWDPDSDNGAGTGSGTAVLNVQDGILRLGHADAMSGNATSPDITVSSGGSLDLNANYSENASWTINGTGHSSLGAIRSSSGTNTISGTGTITLNDGTNNYIGVDSGSTLTISKQITGANPLQKVGDGTLTLSSTANDYTGTTHVNAGTFMLGASNVIANGADINLNSGTFATGGFDDTLDNLTLSANSIIDMASGNSVINFTDFTYSSGTLKIYNWDGIANAGGGNDQLIFATTFASNLSQIEFYSDAGTTLLGTGIFSGNELVAEVVPEPSAYVMIGLLGGLATVHCWRRQKRLKGASLAAS